MSMPAIHPGLFMVAGIGVLTGMDVFLKLAGPHYPTFQLVFLRFAFGLCFSLAVWLYLRPPLPDREAVRINVLRGFIVIVTASCFFYALQTLQLDEAVAFSFLSPLFLALLGAMLLGEAIGRHTLLGLLFGLLGMLAMTLGQGFSGRDLHLPGVAAAIASAVSYALALVLLRQRAQQDALITIVVFQCLVPAIILLGPALYLWRPFRPGDFAIFAAIGGLGVVGHLLLAEAFKRAEASRLAPFEYVALVFAALFGFVIFSEVPSLSTLVGTLLIVAGTFFAMRQRGAAAAPKPASRIEPAPIDRDAA